jgi:hypothetical protein
MGTLLHVIGRCLEFKQFSWSNRKATRKFKACIDSMPRNNVRHSCSNYNEITTCSFLSCIQNIRFGQMPKFQGSSRCKQKRVRKVSWQYDRLRRFNRHNFFDNHIFTNFFHIQHRKKFKYYLFINSNDRTIYPKESNKYTVWKWRVIEHNQGHEEKCSNEYSL